MTVMKILSVALMVIVLAGCGTRSSHFATAPEVPPAPEFHDPGDEVLLANMQEFFRKTDSPLHSQFEFSRLDLDSDGRRDALVFLKSPYGYWCGIHGCTLLVMKAGNDSFTLVNAVQPIRTPVEVSEMRTNGWRNIITRVSGRNHDAAKDVALQFNGQDYPDNPASLPPYIQLAENDHTVKLFP